MRSHWGINDNMIDKETDKILVFDIGGTNLRSSLFDSVQDSLIKVSKIPTFNYLAKPQPTGEEIVGRLFQDIAKLSIAVLDDRLPDIVSIAFPGPVDKRGNALSGPPIWGSLHSEPVPISQELSNLWPSARVLVSNDITCAGYRYLRNSEDDLCVITISSGIGLKVFIQGQPLLGSNSMGGEAGHLKVDFTEDAPICACGVKGHLSAVASGRASVYQAQKLYSSDPLAFKSSAIASLLDGDIKKISNEVIVQAFHQKDSWTYELVKRMATPVGHLLGGIHLTTGIEYFVVVGGFALALGESYRQLLVESANACTWDLSADWDKSIVLGENDDYSGLIGAGCLAKK